MPADSARMLELRRRVQLDPASIAFAQLAEECRRVGSNEEAVEICRAGLARNPGYFSARVTLGRALIELGQLDAAKTELDVVVAGVPDNLAAIRGLAEILHRRGQMTEALEYYRRALELARHDRDLEDTVERISQEVAPAPAPPPSGPEVSIEEIFNFDTLIDQLGLGPPAREAAAAEGPVTQVASAFATEGGFGEASPEPATEVGAFTADESQAIDSASTADLAKDFVTEIPPETVTEASETAIEASAFAAAGGFGGTVLEIPASASGPASLESIELALDDADALAVMERELRELEERRAQDEQRARLALTQRRRDAMIGALETWLSAIVADRERHSA